MPASHDVAEVRSLAPAEITGASVGSPTVDVGVGAVDVGTEDIDGSRVSSTDSTVSVGASTSTVDGGAAGSGCTSGRVSTAAGTTPSGICPTWGKANCSPGKMRLGSSMTSGFEAITWLR